MPTSSGACEPGAGGPREHVLSAHDGVPLFVRDWLPPGAHGAVAILHGLGEHGGRHAHVARFLAERGFAVRVHDHRGHGRSGGPRGDVPDDLAIVRDAGQVIADFAALTGHVPLLLGHSMGGLFAARVAAGGDVPLRALVLSSPALALPLSRLQKALLALMKAVAPGAGVANGLKREFLSHDLSVAAAYAADPLVHDRISARLLGAMLAAIRHVEAHAPALALPVLLLAAGDDRLVDAEGSRRFHALLPPGLGTMRWYPGLYHELFNEAAAARAQVFADLDAWLVRQGLARSAQPA